MIRRLFLTYPIGISLILVLVVFLIDLSLPLGVASAVPYSFAALLALSAKPRWFGPAIAGFCCFLTLLKMGLVPERGTTEMWKVITNRCLALFSIGMTTYLGILRRRAADERERAEERTREHQIELIHMSRLTMLGQLAAGLAHELNQPLAAIGLQSEIAMSQPELTRKALAEIAEQSSRAGEIIRGIRRMSRVGTPGVDPIDLNDTATASIRMLDWQIRQHRVTVTVSLSPVPVVTSADRIQIEQVLLNVLQNALDSIAERGDGPRTIHVVTRIDRDRAVCTIADTGLGLTHPDRVFDRFYTTKPEGLGLGLAICKSIVEAHAGTLNVIPSQVGACFELSLPRLETP